MKKKSKGPTIGVDIAKIARFKDQKALAKKILSPKEMEIYSTHPQPTTYLAGRFAGKEAFIKAYRQPPLPELSSIEVLHRKDVLLIFNFKTTPMKFPYLMMANMSLLWL